MSHFQVQMHRLSTPPRIEQIERLNGVIIGCEDAAKTFRIAADVIDRRIVAPALQVYANQHAAFSKQLQAVVLLLAGTPVEHGSAESAFRRGMLELRALFTRADQVVLRRCAEAETAAWQRYRSALHAGMPEAVHQLLTRQYEEVLRTLEHLDTLIIETAQLGRPR